MNRSIFLALRAGLSHLQRNQPGSWTKQSSSPADRRDTDRRRRISDFRYREFRQRAAIQTAGLGLYDIDAPSNTIRWSAELMVLAGLPARAADLTREQLIQLLHPEDRERVLQKLEASLDPQGNGRFEDEHRLLRPDGAVRWVKVRGQTFIADTPSERTVLGASGVMIDVTERKAAEQILQEQTEELRIALQVGQSGTFQWDARTHEHRWCNEMLALYGLKREEFSGRDEDWLACLLPEDREAAWLAAERAFQTGEYGAEFRIRRRDNGEIRWLSGRGLIVFDEAGLPQRMVGINVDISELKRIQAEREESRNRLEAILNSLSEGVVVADRNGQVLLVNPAALELMGFAEEGQAHRLLDEFTAFFELRTLEGRVLPVEEWPLARALKEEFSGWELELRRRDKDSLAILSHNGTVVSGADGAADLVVITFLDITKRKQAEARLRQKQKRLAGLVAAAMDAIISIDGQQRIVLFNQAAEALFRCPANEAKGMSIERFIPERFRAAHRGYVERFLAEGATSRQMGQLQTLWGLRADGEEFPMEASISKVKVNGTWLMTVILRDVSERFRTEHALRESKEQFTLALKAGRSGAFDWNARTNENHWSDELLALYGLRREEFGGRLEDWIACLHPDDREAGAAAVQESLQTGVFALEFRIQRRDTGEIRWMQGRGQVFIDADGQPQRMVGINIDITEKKHLEEALQQMNESLERRVAERTADLVRSNEELLKSNEELQRFAYIASHDLQTPLRTITSCSQLLQRDYRGRLDERADNLIDRAVGATHRMQVLIRDLLAYARVDSQARPFQPTEMGQVFRTVLTALEGSLPESGAIVTCDELPVVLGDAIQLTQLLQNLIENSIKYRSDAPPQIHVSAENRGEEWLFSVRDNGIGVPPDKCEAVFELFRRLHTHQVYPGTGIGLAICRRVVERHGGRIWVESEPGSGSVFHFTLPHRREKVEP